MSNLCGTELRPLWENYYFLVEGEISVLNSTGKRIEEILLWKSNQLRMLLEISNTLATIDDMKELFQKIVDGAAQIMNLGSAAIYLLNSEDILNLEATFPPLPSGFPDAMKTTSVKNHAHIHRVISTMKEVVLPDAATSQLTQEELNIANSRNLRSLLYIPLNSQGRVIGVLIIGSIAEVHDFTDDEIDICHALANKATLEIERTKLFQELHQAYNELNHAYEETIESLTRGLELRDYETKGHSRRVVDLTIELAKGMGVPEDELVSIQRGALLHDIGKMGISDSILLKPGPLTEDEWQIMCRHPKLAYDMLYPIEYLRPSLTIPLYHHEKYDGSGYPFGKKGEDIPLAARIFAVVDVYDALTNDRPYRKAWTKQDTLQYIKEQSGHHFDPKVVDVFLAMQESVHMVADN